MVQIAFNFHKGILKYYKVSSLIVAHFQHHAILFKRDTSHSMKEVGEVGSAQSSKHQKLSDFLTNLSPNVDTQDILGFPLSVSTDSQM